MRRFIHTSRPNNLGRRLPVPPKNPGIGPGVPVPFFQTRGDDSDAQNINLVLLPAVEPLAQAPHGPCVALVEWGTGSAAVSAEIDIGKGTQVQISASFLSLSVRNDGAVDAGGGRPVDPDRGVQEVIAMISGYGGRVSFGRATRTFYFRTVGVEGGLSVPVPNFAKSLLVSRTSPATTAIAIQLFDNLPARGGDPEFTPGVQVRAEVDIPAGVVATSIDLPAVTSSVTVRNTGTTVIAFLQLAFELCL